MKPTKRAAKSPAKGAPTQLQLNHHADVKNNNRGTNGTNIPNGHVHGNRGAQLNPNQKVQPKPQPQPAAPSVPQLRRIGR
jgi:hypothetical protein